MGIPALIGTPLPLDESVDGKLGIVDGSDGTIYVDPDAETAGRNAEDAAGRGGEENCLLQTLKGKRKYYTGRSENYAVC
ncbi:MAG: hypothetical protein ACLRIL_01725 [Fusicatenibacter saccharivorans]